MAASLPMVVVFPTPFTPTMSITYGFLEKSKGWTGASSSPIRRAISSLMMATSSSMFTYLSFSTRSSMLSMSLSVVSTPISLPRRASSSASSTSSSTLDLPVMALPSFWKKFRLVFFTPLSKIPIVYKDKIFLWGKQALRQLNTCFTAGGAHVLRPDSALDFTDMRFPKQEHAQTGLADTAADGLGKLAVQQQAMEVEG